MLKWIKRIIAIGILGAILAIVGVSVFAYIGLKSAHPPDIRTAPFGVQTYTLNDGEKFPGRIYYAERIEVNGGEAVLTNYWDYDGSKYHHHSGEKVINLPFDIERRVQ